MCKKIWLTLLSAAAMSLSYACSKSSFKGGHQSVPASPQTAPAVAAAPTPTATATPETAPIVSPTATAVPAPSLAPGAITQGSFTVWAVPQNPARGESYKIFVEVHLPTGTSQYMQSDLDGSIVGSDGYPQSLSQSISPTMGFTQPEFTFHSADAKAQLSVWVPGAENKISDTINVHSTLLNEQQSISIKFH